jgi:hypothetical protein
MDGFVFNSLNPGTARVFPVFIGTTAVKADPLNKVEGRRLDENRKHAGCPRVRVRVPS